MIRKGKPAETLGRKTIGPSLFVWQPVTEEVLGISMGKSERESFGLLFSFLKTCDLLKTRYGPYLKTSIGTGGILMRKWVKLLTGLVIFSC